MAEPPVDAERDVITAYVESIDGIKRREMRDRRRREGAEGHQT